MAADFSGFSAQDLAAYFNMTPENAQALIDLSTGRKLSPSEATWAQGQGASIGQYEPGLQHLEEHPKGSHYHGDFNPTDMLANIATGGLYGAAKAAYGGLTGQQNLFDAAKGGLNQLGPFGSATYNIPTYGPQIAQTGNLIGAGAGIGGGGFGALKPAGFGAAGAEGSAAYDPVYFGFNAENLGPAGELSFGGARAPEGFGGLAGLGTSGAEGAAGAVAGGGASNTGALLGGSLAQALGGGSSLTGVPQGGAVPGGGGAPGGLTPAQVAALSAMNSEAHRGLAPSFESRMRGMQQSPGIAGNAFIQ